MLLIALVIVALLLVIVYAYRWRYVRKLFAQGNVSVDGLRGRGKDMLMANIACRTRGQYVSNIDYGGNWIPLDFSAIDLGGNNYINFIAGDIKPWRWPYPDHTDIYISDAGCYLPAQYNGELNKTLKSFPSVMALSRHLGLSNVHVNSQALGRVWDKIREQSDIYIKCVSCKVRGKWVIQRIRLYDSYQSAHDNVPLFPLRRPLFNADRRQQYEIQKANYTISHGNIRGMTLVYRNKSTYDTRRFKTILEGGAYDEDCT